MVLADLPTGAGDLTGLDLDMNALRPTLLALMLLVMAAPSARPEVDLKPLLTGEMAKFTPSPAPKPAQPAPFRDAADTELTLAKFRGQVVLVNLWATWCVPCRVEMPDLDRLQAELGGPDFQVVAISQDRAGATKAKAFLVEIGLKHLDFYIDATMKSGRAWGAYGLPTTFLLDRDGNEVGRYLGPANWASPEAVRLIRAVMAQKPSG